MVALEIQSLPGGRTRIPREAAAHLKQGNQYFAAGELEDARREYETAIELYPRFSEALNNLGAVLAQLGHAEDALKCFKKSLDIGPDDAVTLGNMALVYVLIDELDKALEYFDRSLALGRSNRILNNRASLLGRVGRFEEALIDLSSALALAPDDEVARFNRSGILLALGRPEEALLDIEALLESLPDNLDIARRRREIIDARLRQLADSGFASWSGKRAHGSNNPIPITPGPPVSDYVIQDRR